MKTRCLKNSLCFKKNTRVCRNSEQWEPNWEACTYGTLPNQVHSPLPTGLYKSFSQPCSQSCYPKWVASEKYLCLIATKAATNGTGICSICSIIHNIKMWLKKMLSNNAAAAAAKSLQSCPTLCDPIDGSPPGSPVPGILQARTLECVAIVFSTKYYYMLTIPLTYLH